MKNTSKVKIFLLGSYSNYDPSKFFISGSDKVALSLAELDPKNSVIIGPKSLLTILPKNIKFISNQNFFTRNILVDYIIRTITSFFILRNFSKGNILISSSDFFCDVLPAFLNKRENEWYVFTYHLYPSFFVNLKLRDLLGKLLQDISYIFYRPANKIFTSNFECVAYLKQKFKYFEQVYKIPLGINLNEYYSSNHKNIDILFLGRLKESKGILELPEIISPVREEIPELNVVVIGDGPEKNQILKLNDLFNSQINFLGSVTDSQVKENLANAKILIQLDSEGGFGLNIVEAIASGCYVLGYDLPSYQDNFKDLGLYMSPQKDKKSVAKNLISILSNYQKPSIDRNLLKRYDWKSIFSIIFN